MAEVALSTVVRTCQALGFKWFQDLEVAIARQGRPMTPAVIQDDVRPGDEPATVLDKVGAATREAIRAGLAHVDRTAFAEAFATVANAERLLCLGVGTSAPLAQDIAYRLLWLGAATEAPGRRAHAARPGQQRPARRRHLVVSHTGSTRETVASARAAWAAGGRSSQSRASPARRSPRRPTWS